MTQQEFASILPCYFGQIAQHKNGKTGVIGYIDADGGDIIIGISVPNYGNVMASIGEFKLILRKMEDMTEEENEKANSFPEGSPRVWYFNYLRSIGVDCDGILESEFGIHQKEVKI